MAKKPKVVKPKKKTTEELMAAIAEAMDKGEYYFSDHGEKRSATRKKVNDFEVVKILKDDDKWHEAAKDKFETGYTDWNYHIRGKNSDGDAIRIAVSFDKEGLAIITVINLDEA